MVHRLPHIIDIKYEQFQMFFLMPYAIVTAYLLVTYCTVCLYFLTPHTTNITLRSINWAAEEAVREKEEETVAAQQAASAAVMANMRRAELDAEMNDVINELIDYKVYCF